MSGWIGVDLDGTLAHNGNPGDVYDGSIGPPVPRMVERVKQWLAEGIEVRICTARVNPRNRQDVGGPLMKVPLDVGSQTYEIYTWCVQHIGKALPVTCEKDYEMMELWDDRAVGVERNTGESVANLMFERGWHARVDEEKK